MTRHEMVETRKTVTKPGRVNRQRLRTAYHEAGHAVAAYLLKLPIRHVTIEKDSKSLGHMLPVDPGLTNRKLDDLSPEVRYCAENTMVVALAGPEAERLYADRYDHVGARDDYNKVRNLADGLVGSVEERDAYVKWLRVRAKNVVGLPQNRVYVEAVAAHLLEKITLSEAAVRAVIRQALQRHIADRPGVPVWLEVKTEHGDDH